jgi:predicted PurR-regulated permease PerM
VLSILVLYIAVIYLITLASVHIVPSVLREINEFSASLPEKIDLIKDRTGGFFKDYNITWSIDEIRSKITEFIKQASRLISQNLPSFLSTVTRITTILVSIPVILFFLLKDEDKIHGTLRERLRGRYSQDVWKILEDIDRTLEKYIIGQATVAFVLGVFFFIGYTIIGLNYALLLALIATIMNFIPYLGAVIASIPALLVGFSTSPMMALKVGIIILIVQQTEANLISPFVIGKSLQISPLTVTLLLLGAGSLYGLLGLILITPVYAITKVFVINLFKIYRIRKKESDSLPIS